MMPRRLLSSLVVFAAVQNARAGGPDATAPPVKSAKQKVPEDHMGDAFDPAPKSAKEDALDGKIDELLNLIDGSGMENKSRDDLIAMLGKLSQLQDQQKNMTQEVSRQTALQNKQRQEIAKNLMTVCGSLTMEYLGAPRSSLTRQMKQIEEATEVKELVGSNLMQIIVACAEEMSTQEISKFQRGKLKQLPKDVLNKLADGHREEAVLQLDDMLFIQLKLAVPDIERRSSQYLQLKRYVFGVLRENGWMDVIEEYEDQLYSALDSWLPLQDAQELVNWILAIDPLYWVLAGAAGFTLLLTHMCKRGKKKNRYASRGSHGKKHR